MKKKPEHGVCQFCGCTDLHACVIQREPCAWLDEEHTVCTNPKCFAKLRKAVMAS